VPRQFIRRHLPSRESLHDHPLLRRHARFMVDPRLWALNRRTVAGGLAVGLFAGLIPGPLQMLSAALLAVLFKVNLPIAVFATLYTNPITIVPLYLAAWWIGERLLARGSTFTPPPDIHWHDLAASLGAFVDWMIGLGHPLALGLLVLALALALLGWMLTHLVWRWHVGLAWRRRHRRRSR
jgi:uncharacterized protein (DUF2062 family)